MLYEQQFESSKGDRKCELNCQAIGYRFYVRQAEKVIDGTPCDQHGTAICVSGQCKEPAFSTYGVPDSGHPAPTVFQTLGTRHLRCSRLRAPSSYGVPDSGHPAPMVFQTLGTQHLRCSRLGHPR
nr:ADAMTS-like protein 4 [Oryctolagus cuniculus]